MLVTVAQRYNDMKIKPSITEDLLEHVTEAIAATPRADDDLVVVVASAMGALRLHSTMSEDDLEDLHAAVVRGTPQTRPVPKMMVERLRHFWLLSLDEATGVHADYRATAATLMKAKMPMAIKSMIPHLQAGVLLLRRVYSLHVEEYRPRYAALIPIEAAAAKDEAASAARQTAARVELRSFAVLHSVHSRRVEEYRQRFATLLPIEAAAAKDEAASVAR